MTALRRLLSLVLMFSLVSTSPAFPQLPSSYSDISTATPFLSSLAPGYLARSAVTNILGIDVNTSEGLARLQQVYIPLIASIHKAAAWEKRISTEEQNALEQFSSVFDPLLKLTGYRDAVTPLTQNLSYFERAVLTFKTKVILMETTGVLDILEQTWTKAGRWAEDSHTLSEPFVLYGFDLYGLAKFLPFGFLLLENEGRRNNVGNGNPLFEVINWLNVIIALIHVNQPVKALEEIGGDWKRWWNGDYDSYWEFARQNYLKYRNHFQAIKVAEELTFDVLELLRQPMVMILLLAQGEYGLAWDTAKGFLRELHSTLLRDRKLITLVKPWIGTFYRFVNLLGVALLVVDFDAFYIKGLYAKWYTMLDVSEDPSKFISRFFAVISKALTPVYGLGAILLEIGKESAGNYIINLCAYISAALGGGMVYNYTIGKKLETVWSIDYLGYVITAGKTILDIFMYPKSLKLQGEKITLTNMGAYPNAQVIAIGIYVTYNAIKSHAASLISSSLSYVSAFFTATLSSVPESVRSLWYGEKGDDL